MWGEWYDPHWHMWQRKHVQGKRATKCQNEHILRSERWPHCSSLPWGEPALSYTGRMPLREVGNTSLMRTFPTPKPALTPDSQESHELIKRPIYAQVTQKQICLTLAVLVIHLGYISYRWSDLYLQCLWAVIGVWRPRSGTTPHPSLLLQGCGEGGHTLTGWVWIRTFCHLLSVGLGQVI